MAKTFDARVPRLVQLHAGMLQVDIETAFEQGLVTRTQRQKMATALDSFIDECNDAVACFDKIGLRAKLNRMGDEL